MTLSTQLRLIVLAAGALLLAVIYLVSRRRTSAADADEPHDDVTPARKALAFDDGQPIAIDEDQYDEPSYLRRSARRERVDTITNYNVEEAESLPSVYIDPPVRVISDESQMSPASTLRVPVLSMQDPDKTMPMKVDAVLPSASNVEVVNQTVIAPQSMPAASPATTQRKLIALRLVTSERVPGEQLLAMLHSEGLHHGKFNIFHRLDNDETIFSVASIVEPGSFDLATMHTQQYPGITLFLLLPGPLNGLEAFDQMISCAQRLAQLTSGVVQDENGVLLLESGVERLRTSVLEFENSLQV